MLTLDFSRLYSRSARRRGNCPAEQTKLFRKMAGQCQRASWLPGKASAVNLTIEQKGPGNTSSRPSSPLTVRVCHGIYLHHRWQRLRCQRRQVSLWYDGPSLIQLDVSDALVAKTSHDSQRRWQDDYPNRHITFLRRRKPTKFVVGRCETNTVWRRGHPAAFGRPEQNRALWQTTDAV